MGKYTKEQERVVQHRKGNILISAGAGCGKTFVMKEHVISRIIEGGDISRMLIVTFTVDAAAEMKRRIIEAIDKALVDDPYNVHLQRQRALVPFAHISTIDSLCGDIVKNHFSSSGLDPDYKIGSEAELLQIKKSVFEKILEKHLADGDKDVIELLNKFTSGKVWNIDKDNFLFDSITNKLYSKYASVSDRELFSANLMKISASVHKEFCDIPYLDTDITRRKQIFSNVVFDLKDMTESLNISDSLKAKLISSVIPYYTALSGVSNYDEFYDNVYSSNDYNLGRCRDTSNPDDNAVYEYNELVKQYIKDFKSYYPIDLTFSKISDSIISTCNTNRAYLQLFDEFAARYKEEKYKKNIVDFGDIAYEAYCIIQNPDMKKSLQDQFDLVVVDEYQDSNQLQEDLLCSISHGDNYFMVGDVKQSIYNFRCATPKIFQDKYLKYFLSPDAGTLVDLTDNFRSSREVIDSVNAVFDQIMTPETMGIDYKHYSRLVCGKEKILQEKGCENSCNNITEIHLIGTERSANLAKDEQLAILNNRIIELLNSDYSYFDKDGHKHFITPGDITVLVRTNPEVKLIVNYLSENGIPCASSAEESLWNTEEIKFIVSFLKIILNPRQDDHLLGVLTTPVVGFSSEDIAKILLEYKNANPSLEQICLYDAVINSQDERMKAFIYQLSSYRNRILTISICNLISDIIRDYNYEAYLHSVHKDISVLNQFKAAALDQEKNSNTGLYEFIEYIDMLKAADLNFTANNSSSIDLGNKVHVMTYHKSKGLEFPIVFLPFASDTFQTPKQDIISSFSCIATRDINYEKNTKDDSISYNTLKSQLIYENQQEMQRLLYVAMTRASEKLIIISSNPCTYEKVPIKYLLRCSSYLVQKAKSNIDFITLGVYNNPAAFDLHTYADIDIKDLPINKYSPDFSAQNSTLPQIPDKLPKLYKPSDVNSSYSVSTLKASDYESDEGYSTGYLAPLIEGLGGAELGTAYHLIMEKLEPDKADDISYISELIRGLCERGLIANDIVSSIAPELITAFYKSEMGQKIAGIYKLGGLFREHPFTLGITPSVIDPEASDDDYVRVQGIIDMYLIEDDGITIIDYKTDRIREGEEHILIDHYKTQLDYYQRALEGAYPDLSVKARFLYSFALGEFIPA